MDAKLRTALMGWQIVGVEESLEGGLVLMLVRLRTGEVKRVYLEVAKDCLGIKLDREEVL